MTDGAADLSRRRRFYRRLRRKRAHEGAMTIVEHLSELRGRIILAATAFVAISVLVFFLYPPLLEFLRRPLCDLERTNPDALGPQGCDLFFIKVTGAFQFRLKMTALFGILFSSPVCVYQIYAFVIPALTPKEKRYVIPFVATSTTLFLAGSTFAYLVLPTGLRFLVQIGGEGLTPLLGAEEYLDFVGLMLLAFGVTFQLPLILFFLGLVGVISVQQLRSQRRMALVAITALAAIVTPSQDPYTMLLLALPLYGMYELTIALLAAVLKRKSRS